MMYIIDYILCMLSGKLLTHHLWSHIFDKLVSWSNMNVLFTFNFQIIFSLGIIYMYSAFWGWLMYGLQMVSKRFTFIYMPIFPPFTQNPFSTEFLQRFWAWRVLLVLGSVLWRWWVALWSHGWKLKSSMNHAQSYISGLISTTFSSIWEQTTCLHHSFIQFVKTLFMFIFLPFLCHFIMSYDI